MENERYRKASKAGDLEVDAYNPGLQYAYDKDNLPEALYPTPVGKRAAQKVSELPGHDVIIRKQEGTLFRLSIALVLSVIFAIFAAALAATMAMRLHTVKRSLTRTQPKKIKIPKPKQSEQTNRHVPYHKPDMQHHHSNHGTHKRL